MKNPLLSQLHGLHTEKIQIAFPDLVPKSETSTLFLYKYIAGLPERFFSHSAYETFHKKLHEIDNAFAQELVAYFDEHQTNLDNAFRHAQEINALVWHDQTIKGSDDYQSLILIDRDIHPAYLRLVEAVFQPMLRIAAYFSRVEAGKGTQGLNLFNVIAELQGDRFDDVTAPYEHVMRNGIAHGGVRYSNNEIIYRDSKSNELTLKGYDIVRKFDDMLDVCNGLLLAYSMFAISRTGPDNLAPPNLLVEELRVETGTPYWEVKGALPSTIMNNQSQLIIYCDVQTMDNNKVRFSTVQTAIQAERIASGYDRYFVSMRAKNGLPGMAGFDGSKLAAHRIQNHGIDYYTDIAQDYLPLFLARRKGSRFLQKLETLKYAIQVGWPVMTADYRARTDRPEIIVRASSIHRNSWGAVLHADVIINRGNAEIDQDTVRNNRHAIIKRAKRHARRQLSRFSVDRYLPLGFADIHLFRRDYRVRRLSSFGLGEDLVGTVRLQRLPHIKSPDIFGSTIESSKGIRFAWNKRWLER